jgi:tetratricopeptide (TPR) repeat protein
MFFRTNRQITLAVAAAAVLMTACLWLTICSHAQSNSIRPTYVGNGACAECHSAIYRSYSRHPMASDSGPIAALAPSQKPLNGRFRHQASSIYFRIYQENSKTLFSYERSDDLTTRGKQELDYFVGSGRVGRSYLYSIDGYLYQAPVSFYAQRNQWDISPGYEPDRELPIRPIETSCLFCHASQVQHVDGTLNRYASLAFAQNGVGCERCHGPGSEHVEGRAGMVNPLKLSPARRDSVCAQCHLLSVARILKPGKDLYVFRPGDLLSDYAAYFEYEKDRKQSVSAISHVEEIAQSTCKRRSGDRMSCMSCHDPHYAPTFGERVSYFREKCLACHQAQANSWQKNHFSQNLDCVGCHMQKSTRGDIGHFAFTEHRILRLPLKKEIQPAQGQDLIPFYSENANSPRELGLAYAELALQTKNSRHSSEAFRLLNGVLPTYPKDAEVLTRLAHLYQERGELDRARPLYEAALHEDSHQMVAAVNLGVIYAWDNQIDRAIKLWSEALNYDPGSSAAGINLAEVLCAKGDREQARLILRKVLHFNPDLGVAKQLLRDLDSPKSQCRAGAE